MIQPSPSDCMNVFTKSNLRQMGQVTTVIIGYVHRFEDLFRVPWEGGDDRERDLFAWKIKHHDSDSVALLGCTASFWGDSAGHLVQASQIMNRVKTVLYVSKAGTFCSEYTPNEILATGNSTLMDGKVLRWENVLQKHCQISSMLYQGSHITVQSPLMEDKVWLNRWQSEYKWVDCEIGYLAQASIDGGTSFGYIHIISDNVAREFRYDLSNERLPAVIRAREPLLQEAKEILRAYLGSTNLIEL